MVPQPTIEFESRYLPTRDFILHYIQHGSGFPLLLIHGGGTWLYSFRHNIPELSRFFTVYAVDMPGHGYTESLTGRAVYDIDTVCRELLDFLDTKKLKKIHLAGHSWGGGWAGYFAARYPNRVAKLILIGSSGLNHNERFLWEMMKYPAVSRLMPVFLTKSMVKMGLKKSYYNPSLISDEMVRAIHAPLCRKEIQQAQLDYSKNIDWRKTESVFSEISSPALVIWGKHDQYINVKFAYKMQKRIQNTQVEILDNCGHCVHEECPESVNSLMLSFLNQ